MMAKPGKSVLLSRVVGVELKRLAVYAVLS